MNDEILRSLNSESDKIPHDPNDSPNLVNKHTEASSDIYDRLKGTAAMNHTENVQMWRDFQLDPDGDRGYSLTISLVNQFLRIHTENRVAGLCRAVHSKGIDGFMVEPTYFNIPPGNDVQITLDMEEIDPKSRYTNNPLDSLRTVKTWDEKSVITFKQVYERFGPNGKFNETFTAYPEPGQTVGKMLKGVGGLIDSWQPMLVEKGIGCIGPGTLLQFQLGIGTEDENPNNDNVAIGAKGPVFFYEFIPTIDNIPVDGTRENTVAARSKFTVYPPAHFYDIAICQKGKELDRTMTQPLHKMQKIEGGYYDPGVMTKPNIHARLV